MPRTCGLACDDGEPGVTPVRTGAAGGSTVTVIVTGAAVPSIDVPWAVNESVPTNPLLGS